MRHEKDTSPSFITTVDVWYGLGLAAVVYCVCLLTVPLAPWARNLAAVGAVGGALMSSYARDLREQRQKR